MKINSDGGWGIATGALAVAILWIIISIASCSQVEILRYPDEGKECVIRNGTIEANRAEWIVERCYFPTPQ